VKTGPFANMSVNLGPVGGLNGTAPGPDGGLGYNPRGLKRDVGPAVNMRYANYSTVLSMFYLISPLRQANINCILTSIPFTDLLSKPNISEYRALSEGAPYTIEIGPHGGGHYVIRSVRISIVRAHAHVSNYPQQRRPGRRPLHLSR
jgi:tyrosinase